MLRLRVYIETSVWSFAFAEDVPDYRADTLAFFDRCRAGMFETYVSDVVLEEIEQAAEPLRTHLLDLVRAVHPTLIGFSRTGATLADAFVQARVVPSGKPEDARHVAAAFEQRLDVLVSWNFRHIANVRRAEQFNAVAVLCGHHHPLRIVSPAEVLYDAGNETD